MYEEECVCGDYTWQELVFQTICIFDHEKSRDWSSCGFRTSEHFGNIELCLPAFND